MEDHHVLWPHALAAPAPWPLPPTRRRRASTTASSGFAIAWRARCRGSAARTPWHHDSGSRARCPRANLRQSPRQGRQQGLGERRGEQYARLRRGSTGYRQRLHAVQAEGAAAGPAGPSRAGSRAAPDRPASWRRPHTRQRERVRERPTGASWDETSAFATPMAFLSWQGYSRVPHGVAHQPQQVGVAVGRRKALPGQERHRRGERAGLGSPCRAFWALPSGRRHGWSRSGAPAFAERPGRLAAFCLHGDAGAAATTGGARRERQPLASSPWSLLPPTPRRAPLDLTA